ncbi:MAG: hypothetical protein RSE00_00695 [Clostridia bacterium]
MNNIFNEFSNGFLNGTILGDLDINKLLVIILLLTENLDIEAIHIYKDNFVVSLGTFIEH